MKVMEVLSNVPESLVELWQLLEVYKQDDKIIGAMFCVDDEKNDETYKFALSSDVIDNVDAIKDVFGSEMKARLHTDVQSFTKDGYLRCGLLYSAVEVRESNLDYVFDAPSTKEGYVFVNGSKYCEKDIITFDLVQTLLDALEVCSSLKR